MLFYMKLKIEDLKKFILKLLFQIIMKNLVQDFYKTYQVMKNYTILI